MESATTWANEEFGSARFGDRRLTKRLIQVAGEAAGRPAGQITQVFSTASTREGAFRLVENDAVKVHELVQANSRKCAERSAGNAFVFVPGGRQQPQSHRRQTEQGDRGRGLPTGWERADFRS